MERHAKRAESGLEARSATGLDTTVPVASPCGGTELDLDAILHSEGCLVTGPKHPSDPSLALELEDAEARPGQRIDIVAAIVNRSSAPAWLELEYAAWADTRTLASLLSPSLHRVDGTDVFEPLPGTRSCGGTTGMIFAGMKYLRVRLEPGGRASMRNAVDAIGASPAVSPSGCSPIAPLASGRYELRAAVRFSGGRLLEAKRKLTVSL